MGVFLKKEFFFYLSQLLLATLIYIIAARVGLSMSASIPQVSLVWPPTAIAITTLLLFGKNKWPAIYFGAFYANFTANEPLYTALSIAGGNTLEALTAVYLLDYFKFDIQFQRLTDVVKLIFLTSIIPTLVSATVGSLSLLAGGLIPLDNFWWTFLIWWLGNMCGVVILMPFFLSVKNLDLNDLKFKTAIEFACLTFITVIVSLIIFTDTLPANLSNYPLQYIIFPFMVWSAMRFGIAGAGFINIIVSVIAIYGSTSGLNEFSINILNTEMLMLLSQIRVVIYGSTSLFLAAAISDWRREHLLTGLSEMKFKSMIENSYDSILLADKDGFITYASPSFKRTIGYKPIQMIGRNCFEFVNEADRKKLGSLWAKVKLKSNKSLKSEIRFLNKKGEERILESIFTDLLNTPGVNSVVINFKDITENKKFDDNKREFVSFAAHQLRTPITVIKMYTELILTTKKYDRANLLKFIETINATVNNMADTVGILLNISELEMGTLRKDAGRLDLAEHTVSLLGKFQISLKKKNITLHTKIPKSLMFITDQKLFDIVFDNLVSNAIRYGRANGEVMVSLTRKDKGIELKVKDDGIGIPENERQNIFNKSYRATNAIKAYAHGTGLGLYLVNKIVKILNGKIFFKSKENKGTVFSVSLF